MPGQIASSLIPELQHEANATRKLLSRLPVEKRDWAPHPKSFTLGKLATHVAQLVGWTGITCTTDVLDLNDPYPAPEWKNNDELVAVFDGYLADTIKALAATSDADMMKPWTLKHGETVIFTMSKIQTIRGMCINHFIHHRGQLSLYLRLNDVPLPNMYGPTADEQ